jgi:hypothetical protein
MVGGSLVDIGDVKLAGGDSTVAIFGQVKDVESQKPIGQATVSIVGTHLTATTDATGKYRLEDVPQGSKTVRFSAQGYTSETMTFSVSPYNELPLNGSLRSGTGGEIRLSVATDQPNYTAYAPVAILVNVNNLGGEAISGGVTAIVEDEHGNYVASITASRPDANGAETKLLNFAVGETPVALTWNTLDIAPGSYKINVRLSQPAPGPDRSAIELAQQHSVITVDSTQAIESVALTPLPAFSRLGATEQVGFKVDVVNRSNVAVSSKLTYQLRTPTGAVALQGEVDLKLVPAESSGHYLSQLAVEQGEVPAQLSAAAVEIAPGTRIDPVLKATPGTVVPDGDKRIRFEIRLQGVEQK